MHSGSTGREGRPIEGEAGDDQERFARVYDAYGQRVYAFALRLAGRKNEAEDLFSETMLRTFSAIKRGSEPEGDMFPWLCTICVNAFRDTKRKERTRRLYEEDVRSRYYPGSSWDPGAHGTSEQELGASWQQIHSLIAAMPSDQRTCLLLKLAGHSYQEICELMGVDQRQLKNSIQNAMYALRARFSHRK
ncbi:MAG: RNA polymerase sigma factor [Acidobacteriota bacterium]